MAWLTGPATALGVLIRWSWTEVCNRMPDGLSRLGPRTRVAVAELDPTGRWHWVGQVETSWLGTGTFRREDVAHEPDAAILILPDRAQFRTRIRLGAQACRRGAAAVDLRRGQFTPVPVETARHASEFAGPVTGGGAEVDISVIRATALDAALASTPAGVRNVRVVGELDATGRPRFQFHRSGDAGMEWGLPIATLVLALLVTASLWSARLARDEVALDARRADLMVEARDLRASDEALAWAEAVRDDMTGVPLAVVMQGLADLPDTLPSDVVIERVRLESDTRLAVQTALAMPDAVNVQTVLVALEEGVE